MALSQITDQSGHIALVLNSLCTVNICFPILKIFHGLQSSVKCETNIYWSIEAQLHEIVQAYLTDCTLQTLYLHIIYCANTR